MIRGKQTVHTGIESIKSLSLAGAQIDFLPVNHTISCYAVKITYHGKVFVYSADTTYIESLADFAKNADLFICEATICEGSTHTVGKWHMDAREAATLAKKANVKLLVLSHLPSDGDFSLMEQQAKEIFPHVHLATEIATLHI